MKMMNVAIIGQGRSGRDIHGAFFKSQSNDFCRVVCIVEEDAGRRARAAEEFGCEVLSDYRELFGRDGIDVVVNASYSQMHYAITRDLLSHGFNVLSEKPMARTYYECMDLVNVAKKNGALLAVFHQTLLNPTFLKIKEIIASGRLGDVYQINMKYSGFGRRWDWQTLQSCCAGSLYNSGPHPVGQALDLLGWDKNTRVAYSSLDTVLTLGDSDDFTKLILKAPDKPTVDIEVISADAYAGDYVTKIFGSRGTLLATNTSYKMKYIPDMSVYPDREVKNTFIAKEDGTPAYCSEKLEFVEESEEGLGSSFDGAVHAFYKMLYNSVILGEQLLITPEQIAQVISVIETCHAENPLPVKFD